MDLHEFLLQFPEGGCQTSKMAYNSLFVVNIRPSFGEFTAPLCHILPTHNVTISSKNFFLNFLWTSGTPTSSVRNFAFSAASRTVSSTVHKLYCRSEVFKYSNACSTMFSSISIKHINKRGQLLSPDGRHFIPLSPTIMHSDELRSFS